MPTFSPTVKRVQFLALLTLFIEPRSYKPAA